MQQTKYPCYLQTFKTEPCPNPDIFHNLKQCMFYHSLQDRRRQTNYSSEKCNFKSCKEDCPYSHNVVEQMYHHERFKTRYCQNFENPQECIYGQYCSFVHEESEFRINLLHLQEQNNYFFMFEYKTVMCPLTENHNRLHCVYAHNQQDFRRKLMKDKQIAYQPYDCKDWKKFQNLNFYIEGGCQKMMECQYSHGWKEHDYHVMIYKTRLCKQGSDCQFKNFDCPFFHTEEDQRTKLDVENDLQIFDQRTQYQPSTEASFDDNLENFESSLSEDCPNSTNEIEKYRRDLRTSLDILDEILVSNQKKLLCMIQKCV